MHGLKLLADWIQECDIVESEEPKQFKYGNDAQNRKIKLKLLQLLNDLVLNDDSILPGGTQIRDLYCQHEELIEKLLVIIESSDITKNPEF